MILAFNKEGNIENTLPEVPDRKYLLASLFYVDEQWEEAKDLFELLLKEDPDNIRYRGFLGKIHAQLGDRNSALDIYDWLKNRDVKYRRYLPIKFMAEIMAILGEKERSFDHLKEAYQKGLMFAPGMIYKHETYWNVDTELFMGYPPYEEFMRPRK